MSPVERWAAGYAPGHPRTFKSDLEAHLLHGYVFSTPEWFIMGRAVHAQADPELIKDPWHVFPREEHDCWLIFAYANLSRHNFIGLVEKFLRVMPYALPLVAWERERDYRLRFYPIKRFTK